jgi:hypothetical protein
MTWTRTLTFASDLWQRTPPLARSLALVAPLVIGLGIMTGTLSPQTHDEWFLAGRTFSRDELARLEGAWAAGNLSGHCVESGRVRIPKHKSAEYLAAAERKGALPVDFGDELFRISQELSPFLSHVAREETLRIAKQQMLARIIRRMDDIEAAWVVLDEQSRGGLHEEARFTASVSLQTAHHRPLDTRRYPQIQRLVASAVAGLDPERVTVVDLNAPGQSSSDGEGGEALGEIIAFENYYQNRIARALSHIPGVDVLVTASVAAPVIRLSVAEPKDEAAVFPNPGPLRLEAATPASRTAPESQPPRQPDRVTALVSVPAASWSEETDSQAAVAELRQTIASLLPSGSVDDVTIQVLPTPAVQVAGTETTPVPQWLQMPSAWITLTGVALMVLAAAWAVFRPVPPSDVLSVSGDGPDSGPAAAAALSRELRRAS